MYIARRCGVITAWYAGKYGEHSKYGKYRRHGIRRRVVSVVVSKRRSAGRVYGKRAHLVHADTRSTRELGRTLFMRRQTRTMAKIWTEKRPPRRGGTRGLSQRPRRAAWDGEVGDRRGG